MIKEIMIMTAALMGLSAEQSQAQVPNTSDLYMQTSEMNSTMILYNADKGSLSRFYAVGGNAYGDGRMVFYSPECMASLQGLNNDYLKKLEQINFDKMSINGKVDYLLFKRDLEDALSEILEVRKKYDQAVKYLPFADEVYRLEKPRRRGEAVNGEQVAKELNEILKQVKKLTGELKKDNSDISKEVSAEASDAVKGLQGILKNVYDFYNGYDPLFTWWVPKTYSDLDIALNEYAGLLRSKGDDVPVKKADASGIGGHPIGKQELIRQLRQEFIPYGPEDLVEIANREFAWCDAELLKASREMGFGDNWKAAQEKIKNSYVAPGKQPEAMFDLYKQSLAFLKKNDLVTIPDLADETWRMIMMSPERQRVNPFFTGGEVLSISYPTNTMSYEDKIMSMRGNNPHFSRATVHHELIAGHHLQQYMTSRYKTYRHFDTPFWVEGNALYWEMLLWDLKFPRSPEDRMGMLFWRMHRCARIIFSLNYHLGNWGPQQCIDFLVDRVGHERANAEGEVRRSFEGGYSPLYQIAYMIGGLQLYSLKKELVDSKKMTYKEYHDAIFRENSIPIEMLRAILINQPLKRDFKTSWKF